MTLPLLLAKVKKNRKKKKIPLFTSNIVDYYIVDYYPTTLFCKISVRRSKYCLEFFYYLRTAKNFLMTFPLMYNF